MNAEPLTPSQLAELRALSTCVVASAIETFDVRLRNRGFTDSRLHCMFPELPASGGLRGHGSHPQFRSSHGRAQLLRSRRVVGFAAENSSATNCGD